MTGPPAPSRRATEAPVVVVGAGIAGLAAAWEVAGDRPVTVIEAADRPGGKIDTETVAGMPVERGPDVFLARVPWAVELCHQLDLAEHLISPSTTTAYLWTRGRLRPIPDGLALGIPTDLAAVARSGALSPWGLARAALDVVLPRVASREADPSVGEVIRRRFGREVADQLVGPLVGGINAGDIDRLSLRAALPQVALAAEGHRSLMLALRRPAPTADRLAGGGPAGPVFHSLRPGLRLLIDRLEDRLRARGVEVRLATRVDAVRPARTEGPGPVELHLAGGDTVAAAGVVLATPAFVTAELVRSASPEAAAALDRVQHASVVVLTLAFRRADVRHPLDGSGFLVPRAEHRLMTACTWYSSKWAETAPDDHVVLRLSAGRFGDDRAVDLDEEELVQRLLGELREAVGITAPPVDARLTRWARAFPQYEPGHLGRVEAIEAALGRDLPGVAVAGAAYRGVGLPACIRQGREAARTIAAVAAGGGGGGAGTGSRPGEAGR